MDTKSVSGQMLLSKNEGEQSAFFKQINTPKFRAVLWIAFVVGLAVYYFLLAGKGLSTIDESFYLTIPHRLLQGDSLLVDEWHVSQFSSVLQYLPFKLYYLVTGGTDGVVLFFRYLYIVCQLSVSSFAYYKFRNCGFPALLTAGLYCHYTVMNVMTLSYYTMSLMACTLFCLLIFTDVKQKGFTLFFSGILLACAVLSEPFLALIYFAYTLIVFINKIFKKKFLSVVADIMSLRTWCYISSGVLLSAAFFLCFWLSRASIMDIISAIPNFFTDSEYAFSLFSPNNANLVDSTIVWQLIKLGIYNYIADAALLIILLLDKKKKKHRKIYFFISTVLLVTSYISLCYCFAVNDSRVVFSRHIPFAVFVLFCFVISERRDKRLFCFWAFGLAYSILIDISSANYYNVPLLGSVLSDLPGVIFVATAISEICDNTVKSSNKSKKAKNKSAVSRHRVLSKSAISVVAVVAVLSVMIIEVTSFHLESNIHIFENHFAASDEKLSQTVDSGPLKGIKTTPQARYVYNKILEDLDYIKNGSDGCFYVDSLFSWMYLYLDKPYGTYSAWFVEQDNRTRLPDYWALFPDRVPSYIYVSKLSCFGFTNEWENADKSLNFWSKYFYCDVTESDVGYILKIDGIRQAIV